jgi:hypothetical protein
MAAEDGELQAVVASRSLSGSGSVRMGSPSRPAGVEIAYEDYVVEEDGR